MNGRPGNATLAVGAAMVDCTNAPIAKKDGRTYILEDMVVN